MKQLEIEKTKPTFIVSVLKVDVVKVGLVFSVSNFFITKTSHASKWMRKKLPSLPALGIHILYFPFLNKGSFIKILLTF